MAWEKLDLRPFGYAPGGYGFKCVDCPPDTDPMSHWAAKRAWRCQKHALKAMAVHIEFPAPAAGAPKTTLDGDPRNRFHFEKWARNAVPQFSPSGIVIRGGEFVYNHNIVQLMWECWRAARAA